MKTDILANWRTLPKENRTVALRTNSIKIIADMAEERGISFDESLDHLVIYAFCHISRNELLKHVEAMKADGMNTAQ